MISKQFQWHPNASLFFEGVQLKQSDLKHHGLTVLDAIFTSVTALCPYFQTQSGGTTGQPKTLKRSHSSWLRSFDIHQSLFKIGPHSRYGVLGRLDHSLALYATVEAINLGSDVHLMGHLRPNEQAAALQNIPCSVIYATPTQVMRLVDYNCLKQTDVILIGGGRLSPEQRTAVTRAAPNADIRVFYGAAETSFITLSDHQTPLDSVGRAYPNVKIDIRSIDEASDIGEIWVQSPYLFECYSDGSSDETRWNGDWLSVGELGRMDDDGYLFLHGRKNRMFTIADQNIYPEAIERVLSNHPTISQSAVIPMPDEKRGSRAIAFHDGHNLSASDLRKWCRISLSDRAVPSEFVYITKDDWPFLSSGKTDLRALTTRLDFLS